MVLRPGRPEGCPWTVEDIVGPFNQHADHLTYDALRVVEVDFPAPSVGELGEHLAIPEGFALDGLYSLKRERLGCLLPWLSRMASIPARTSASSLPA